MQAVLAQIVLVGFLILVLYIRPYNRAIDNHLQILSLVGGSLQSVSQSLCLSVGVPVCRFVW